MHFTPRESETIALALGYWANWLETGNIVMSAKDAEAAKKPFKALDVNQMEKVIELRKLAQRVLRDSSENCSALQDEAYWKSVER